MYLTYRLHLVGINKVIQRFSCSDGEQQLLLVACSSNLPLTHQTTNTSTLLSQIHAEAANTLAEDRVRCAMHLPRRIAIELQSCRKQCPVWRRPGHSWQWQSHAALVIGTSTANDRYTCDRRYVVMGISYPGIHLIQNPIYNTTSLTSQLLAIKYLVYIIQWYLGWRR